MKKISLSQGRFALIDAEDFEFLNQWEWCYSRGYALRNEYIGMIDGKQKAKRIPMHRLVNKTPDDLQTDHINGDKLDNRKCNLRSCTSSQNHMNKKSPKNSTSKYKGVHWYKKGKKWKSEIRINKKGQYLGYFKSEIEAAKAYNKAAIELFGEFAKLNKIGK